MPRITTWVTENAKRLREQLALFERNTHDQFGDVGNRIARVIASIPTTLPPSGNAGGDLSGTYPNPSIAAGAIVNADINAGAAIDLSKLQNINTQVVLGREIAGIGDIQQLFNDGTLNIASALIGRAPITGDVTIAGGSNSATVTDLTIASEAHGDLLYRNASNWVRLAAGTSGQQLQTLGPAANPLWATPLPERVASPYAIGHTDLCAGSGDDFAITVTGGATVAAANFAGHPGAITCTVGAAPDRAQFTAVVGTVPNESKFAATFRNAANTNRRWRLGWGSLPDLFDSAGNFIVCHTETSVGLRLITRNAGSQTLSSDITVTGSAWYTVTLEINLARSQVVMRLYDDSGSLIGSKTNSANIPPEADMSLAGATYAYAAGAGSGSIDRLAFRHGGPNNPTVRYTPPTSFWAE